MKIQIGLFFIFSAISINLLAQSITTEIVRLEASKPIFLTVQTSNIGPDFQCYFGLKYGRNESVFPAILNSKKLNMTDSFNYSDTFEYSITDVEKLDGYEFASLVECWVSEGDSMTSSGHFSIQLGQDKNGPVLFKDSFSGLIQQGNFNLWQSSPREFIKRIKFKLN
jgi:hypothetical protein